MATAQCCLWCSPDVGCCGVGPMCFGCVRCAVPCFNTMVTFSQQVSLTRRRHRMYKMKPLSRSRAHTGSQWVHFPSRSAILSPPWRPSSSLRPSASPRLWCSQRRTVRTAPRRSVRWTLSARNTSPSSLTRACRSFGPGFVCIFVSMEFLWVIQVLSVAVTTRSHGPFLVFLRQCCEIACYPTLSADRARVPLPGISHSSLDMCFHC